MICFADSSSLAKRYVAESGTAWLRALLAPATGNVVVIVRITAAELVAALSRRARGGSLSVAEAAAARADFRAHLANEYQIVEVDAALVNAAMALAEAHGLRGYDAVQLAAALEVNASYRAAGYPPVTLLSADLELNTAAQVEGLLVENPNAHS